MAALDRVRVALTGFVGGPGVGTFYAVSGSDLQIPLFHFWDSVSAYMPPDVTLHVEVSGDTIDDTDGALIGSWVGSDTGTFPATGGGDYAAPAGACVTWLSPLIRDGHRIKGRTFVVPLSGAFYQNDGSLQPACLAALVAAAEAFVTAAGGNFRIWHRPRLAQVASPGHRALTAHDGSQAAVTASSVRDKVAVLRSRRD